MTFQPVVIIGAPRSGTNILRDVLAGLPGFATWPCDEINFAWKHGSITVATDELPAERAGRAARSYVRKQFQSVARRSGASFVVEKTCANCLRVPYVDRLVPEARYLLLLRDGRDAVASIIKRWGQPVPGGRYYLNKLRFVAPLDLPWVLASGLGRRLGGRGRWGERSWSIWGPVFDELLEAVAEERPLAEICALQWARCVERSIEGLDRIEPERWIAVSYERFVERSAEELGRLVTFLGATVDGASIQAGVRSVSARSVGKWRRDLAPEALSLVDPVVADAMRHAAEVTGRQGP